MDKSYYYDDKGTTVIERLANDSDATACYVLAKRYSKGTTLLKKDEKKANYWYGKALSNIENLDANLISDKVELALWLFENNYLEKAMNVADNISGNYTAAYIYELFFRETGEEKYREEAIERYKECLTCSTSEVIYEAFNDIFETYPSKELFGKSLNSLSDNRIETFKKLSELTNDLFQKRHFLIGALSEKTIDARERFNSVNDSVIKCFDRAYKRKKGNDKIGLSQDGFSDDTADILFSSIGYSERQFIYFAKDIKTLAGCYNESLPWVFTLDKYPEEIHFSNYGHPLPNTIYIAHPAKKGLYLPIENADDELFHDKVRDFRRLSQCLGATEIAFRSVKGQLVSEEQSEERGIEIVGDYKGFEGNVGYNYKRGRSQKEGSKSQRELIQRFNPTQAPYVPDDVAWLSIDSEWQLLAKQRIEGNMLHYSMRISSKKTMAVTDTRMNEVKLAFKSFIANAHIDYSQQMDRSFQREEETIWEINVSFKPNEEPNSMQTDRVKGVLDKKEQEYLDNLREFLEDDAEITPQERKMLNRIRQSLGISEERAAELEASLKPQLTEDEQEYLDMYREYASKGEVTDKERRRLHKFAVALGIDEVRMKEIELLTM